MSDIVTTPVSRDLPMPVAPDLLDAHLPAYDVALTEHIVVEAAPDVVFATAQDFDFLTTDAPLVTVLMTMRAIPSRLRGRQVATPASLRLAKDPGALLGWVLLGDVPGREVVFGAVGTFWTPSFDHVSHDSRLVARVE